MKGNEKERDVGGREGEGRLSGEREVGKKAKSLM